MNQIANEWAEAKRICALPDVDEAIQAFSDDSTYDGAVVLVCAVLRAAGAGAPQPAQAALSDAINDLMDFAPCKRAQPDGMTRGGPYVRKADVLNILAASHQPAAAPVQAAVAPEGYVLVPVEPTPQMLAHAIMPRSTYSTDMAHEAAVTYRTMLAAAPAAPSQAPVQPADAAPVDAVTDTDILMLYAVAGEMRRNESPRCASDLMNLAERLEVMKNTAQAAAPVLEPWKWLVSWGMGDEEICQTEALAKRQKRLLDENGWLNVVIEPIYRAAAPAATSPAPVQAQAMPVTDYHAAFEQWATTDGKREFAPYNLKLNKWRLNDGNRWYYYERTQYTFQGFCAGLKFRSTPTPAEIDLAMKLGAAEGTLRAIATVSKDKFITKTAADALAKLKGASHD